MEFSRQEYWTGLPFTTPGNLPDLGIKPASLGSPALSGRFFTTAATLLPSLLYSESETPQLCPTLCDPMMCSTSGLPVHHQLPEFTHTISKVKRQPSEWEKMIANETTDKRLVSKIYKQLIQLNTRKINNPMKK